MAGKKILLVEGTDDEHVLKHLCGQRGVQQIDEIKPQGSVERLLESFPVRLKESDIEALGIVIDADTDLPARWDSLKHRLTTAGYPVNDIQIPGRDSVSRRHCVVVSYRNDVWLYDLNSTGTHVNGQRVSGKLPLIGRSTVHIGGKELIITSEKGILL